MFGTTAGAGPAAQSANARGASTSTKAAFLPGWLESAVPSAGYALNKSMPSLGTLHASLAEIVPGVKREDAAHIIGAIVCPNTLKLPRTHPSNGIYVVVHGEAVYAKCSDSACCYPRGASKDSGNAGDDDGDDGAELVEGTNMWRRPWVKYTEESYRRLLSKMKA